MIFDFMFVIAPKRFRDILVELFFVLGLSSRLIFTTSSVGCFILAVGLPAAHQSPFS